MRMYEMACGANEFCVSLLINVLGMKIKNQEELNGLIPRFRDAFVTEDINAPQIVIFTRTGGGNRSEYEGESISPNNHDLRGIEGFVRDEDWGLDSTYAFFIMMCRLQKRTM